MSNIKLGICPIGWTNDDMPDLGAENTFQQCISEMALAGFKGCELGGKFPKDMEELKKALALRDLSVASAWFSSFLTTKPYEETEVEFRKHCDLLKNLGAKVVVVSEQGNSIQGQLKTPLFANKPINTREQWDKVYDGLNKLGKVAQEYGLKLVYHHHMGTGVQTTEEIDLLMENTDPNLVFLLFDTGHLVVSGEDPLYVLEKYMNRIKHVHLKDVRLDVLSKVKNENLSFLDGVRMGMFTVPGDGSIDFKPIYDMLVAKGYEGWTMVEAEQDPSLANPLEYAIKARKYINKVSGL